MQIFSSFALFVWATRRPEKMASEFFKNTLRTTCTKRLSTMCNFFFFFFFFFSFFSPANINLLDLDILESPRIQEINPRDNKSSN
jgi:hypothetical protein